MLRVNLGVRKGKMGRCPKSSGFLGEFAAVQAGRFVQPFVCSFVPSTSGFARLKGCFGGADTRE